MLRRTSCHTALSPRCAVLPPALRCAVLCRYELGSEEDGLDAARRKQTSLLPRFHVLLTTYEVGSTLTVPLQYPCSTPAVPHGGPFADAWVCAPFALALLAPGTPADWPPALSGPNSATSCFAF